MGELINLRGQMWLGAMQFGGAADAEASDRIFEVFYNAGGRMIDTADSYNSGQSERIVRSLISSVRDEITLATKVGNPDLSVDGSGGLSVSWIKRAAERSLDRLQTDRIDVYYLHQEDDTIALDETIGALGELQSDGLIRDWGFSNFRPWKIAEMVRQADLLNVSRPLWAQPYYHMLNRVAEADFLPACAHYGIHCAAYSPLARGVLTGKYTDGRMPTKSRANRGDKRILETEMAPESLAAAKHVADYAEGRGAAVAALAVQWVLANRVVKSIVAGPRTPDQMQSYIDALSLDYSEVDETSLSALCPPGHHVSPHFLDPRYPLRGRPTGNTARKALP